MENVTRALIMAFSMLIFAVSFAFSMYLVNGLTTTANTLLGSVSTTNYYDNIKVDGTQTTKRDVGIETIIPTLYRYSKESYSVKIVENNGSLIQLFDTTIESKMPRASGYTGTSTTNTELATLHDSIYNNNGSKFVIGNTAEKAYMFGAPWTGNQDNTKTRIDYFLNGTNGYINNSYVGYADTIKEGSKKGFIEVYGDKTFEESFIEYAYSGETISTANGIETITGNTQESSKIIITYKVKD